MLADVYECWAPKVVTEIGVLEAVTTARTTHDCDDNTDCTVAMIKQKIA